MGKLGLSMLLLLGLSACSWLSGVPGMNRIAGEDGMFRDRQADYLEAETIPRTEIPPGLDSFIIDDLLVIPEINAVNGQPFLEPPRPNPIEGRSDREVVIQRMDNRSWIVVDVSPSEVWPRIRDYWRQAGVEVAIENPVAGIMDTAWYFRQGSALVQDRFRVIVENGFQNNSSEIRLLHSSVQQATPVFTQVPWPGQSQDADVEFDTLNDMSTYLADVADLYQASSVSFLAGNISSAGKANIVTNAAGEEVLQLQAEFNRSWAAIGRALNRAEVEISAQDLAAGVYEVQYTPGQEDDAGDDGPGIFTRIFTLNGLFGGDDTEDAFLLRVELRDAGERVDVMISAPESRSPAADDARQRLLTLLRNTIA